MASTQSETISLKVTPEKRGLFRKECTSAAMTESDAAREAIDLWMKNRGENAKLVALANEVKMLTEAVANMRDVLMDLRNQFDGCVQINLEADEPAAKKVREAVARKTVEPEEVGTLVGAGV